MYKQKSEYKSVQKKLVAAVAMVLVACIMVVSTSYAWFTLSTAPEVTGITTAVGSNGNLEMALRQVENLELITTGVGLSFPQANTTWGNLVDLSDPSYMLSAVKLAPARLNITLDTSNTVYGDKSVTVVKDQKDESLVVGGKYEGIEIESVALVMKDADGEVVTEEIDATTYEYTVTLKEQPVVKPAYMLNGSTYLKTPVYDVYGRLQSVGTDGVINGVYNVQSNGFVAMDKAFGVKAIGTSSSMTPEEMALRTAKQTVSTAITTAKTAASTSLRVDSVKLAGIIISNFVADDAAFTTDDVNAVKTAVDNLKSISLDLTNALDQAVIAVGVAQAKEISTVEVSASGWTAKDKAGATVTLDWTGLETMQNVLDEAYGVVNGIDSTLSAATNALPGEKASYTWADLSGVMTQLLGVNDIEIISSRDGSVYSPTELMDLPLMTAAGILMATPTVSIINGVYCDIAELTGNYSASANMSVNVEYQGISLKDEPVSVVMATSADENTIDSISGFYLPMVLGQLSSVTVGEGGTASTVITDIYGYAIDLAFRTNAVGSSLLLQTEAKDRVDDNYEDSVTQGAGSYMQFTTENPQFTLQQVANLMSSIRVVFLNDAGNIYGVAALDVSGELQFLLDGENKIEITDENAAQYDFTMKDTDNKTYAAELKSGTVVTVDGKKYVRADLYLYGFTVDAEGKMTLGEKLSTDVITALEQNTALGVTTLVYLDGDLVENKDVAISGDSMTGSMNLQFASSAELDPMDYTFATQTALAKPVVTYENDTLTINAVEGASSYSVYYGNQKLVDVDAAADGNTTYTGVLATLQDKSAPAGNYEITVVANPDAGSTQYKSSVNSEPVTITVP